MEVLTHAGYPNPHQRPPDLPTPVGVPQSFGPPPQEPSPPATSSSDGASKLDAERVSAAHAKAAASVAAGGQLLSEQVLQQKALIAELEEKKSQEAQQAVAEECEADEDSESEDEDPSKALRELLENVTPCAAAYPVSLAQSTERQRVAGSSDRWTDVKGMRLLMKPANEEDCILLVANAVCSPEADREESHWALNRGGHRISSKFSTFSRQRSWSHHICLPWLDQPGKKAEQDYQVSANSGRESMHFMISEAKQRRQLFGLTLPAYQVSWVEDDEALAVPVGPWQDVNGMHEVVTTLPGDRVLALCTMRYAAQWSSELNRGRFTLVRDDLGLDGLADRGLQSVRSLGPNLHRSLLMATVDEPGPGPHLYRVRAAVTASENGVSTTLQGERQLSLIRLPGNLVCGPMHVSGPVEVTEETWTEIPGLAVTISLRKARDRVLLVYHTDCNPLGHFYEAHFTLFRRKEASAGPAQNLGFSEDFGMDMVFSDYTASSEYPVGLFCDTPGSLGTWTYYLAARVANMGTSRESPGVVVGYSGSLTAVLLTTR